MNDLHKLEDSRTAILLQTVRQLSMAQTPQEVLATYGQGLRNLGQEELSFLSLSVRGLEPGQYKITRFYEKHDQLLDDTTNPWEQWDHLETWTGGLLGELIAQPTPTWLENLCVPSDPVLGDRLAGYKSLLAVPLFDGGEALNWGVLLSHEADAFNATSVGDILLRSNLVGMTVRHVRMAEQLKQAHERIAKEVQLIARIQQGLMPASLPEIPGLKLAADFRTYDTAGGDLYDIHPLTPNPQGPWAILMADASGHGPAATTVSAMMHAILHTYPTRPQGPAQLLAHANRHLSAKRIESSFVTAVLAFFDPVKRTLTYARAGHPPLLLKSQGQSGAVQRLDEVGEFPLGISDDVSFNEATIILAENQTVLFYTDGITEAKNTNEEMFGIEGIERSLDHCMGDPDCTVHSIHQSVRKHESGIRPMDDQTLLAIQVVGS